MKWILFVPVVIVATIFSVALGLLSWCLIIPLAIMGGTFEALSHLMFKFEMWATNSPRGYFINCPYKTTAIKSFKEGFDRVINPFW